MSELAATACHRCREQKLRCTREQPSCARCFRLKTECTFPHPPNRKLLAAQRTARQKQRQHAAEASSSATSQRQAAEPDDFEHLPSKEGQEVLIEAYFACAFNASLCLHRPAFTRDWNGDRLPRALLLAVFAMGSIFLTPSSGLGQQHATIIATIDDLPAKAQRWASLAAKQALQDIDQPNLTAIQVCQILSMYWCAMNEPNRNTMFSGIAYRASRTLGSDIRRLSTADHDQTLTLSASTDWLELEKLRRCFWASWSTTCINFDHCDINLSSTGWVMDVPLPATDVAYWEGTEEYQGTLSIVESEIDAEPPTRSAADFSVMAEVMKLILRWARIREHIECRRHLSSKKILAQLFELEKGLLDWAATVPLRYAYSQEHLFEQLIIHRIPAYSLLFALYHQCRLVLHASVVPQMSGLPSPKGTPPDVVWMSARHAVQSAQALSQLSADMVAVRCDAAQIAPFVGYCLYASACIHVSFIFSSNQQLATRARSDLLSSLKLLRAIKPFWKMLDRLWDRILLLYRSHNLRRMYMGPADQSAVLNDINEIATIRRDAEQLPEPLADSLLQYSGQTLWHPIANPDVAGASGQVEEAMRDDLMAHMDVTTGAEASAQTAASVDIGEPMLEIPPEWWDEVFQMFPEGTLPDSDHYGSFV